MENYVVSFVGKNGKIIGTASLSEREFQHQIATRKDVVHGNYVGTHYFEDGVLKPIPPKPDDLYLFDYAKKQWVADVAAIVLRRNQLLADSDWTQLPDVPLATKEAWATYRQALRDITAQPGFPENVVWPEAPK